MAKPAADSIDVVFSFDTTGSMYPCLTQVRTNIVQTVERLFKEIPNINIGIIAHGDYCDEGRPYVLRSLPLSADKNVIIKFVKEVEATGGGDSPECYELVLNEARRLNWRAGKEKVLVVIGDDVPHPPSYPMNKLKLDWKNELDLLLEAGVHVYGVHALASCRQHSKPFYEEMAKRTEGYYLQLEQFQHITDAVFAICYKQTGDQRVIDFEKEVEKRQGQVPWTERRLFDSLLDRPLTPAPAGYDRYETRSTWRPTPAAKKGPSGAKVNSISDGLVPVPAARFQVLEVKEKTCIEDFAKDNGLKFQRGRGFYEFQKAVDVQDYKEVILQMEDGTMYSGKDARKMIGAPEKGTASITQKHVAEAKTKGVKTVFIQSTSTNRALLANTLFLYEVEDWEVSKAA